MVPLPLPLLQDPESQYHPILRRGLLRPLHSPPPIPVGQNVRVGLVRTAIRLVRAGGQTRMSVV